MRDAWRKTIKMTVCYLIQTYKNPEQIYRLVKLIQNTTSNSFIIVSHNFSSCSLNTNLFKKLHNVQVISNNGVMMGGFDIIQGFLEAVAWLLDHKIQFDWFINLTGQDYPTQSLDKIENFLEKTDYDGFLEYFNVLSNQSPWSQQLVNTRYLYQYKHFPEYLSPGQQYMLKPIKYIINNCQPFFRLDYSYGVIVGIKNYCNLFDKNFTCYGGSYFATLSHQCTNYLYEFACENSKIIDYYRKTFIPEESFIQTVLVNSKKFKLCNNNYRYTDFAGSRHGHPRILTDKDFSVLIKDNIHFARKFDMSVDSQILDRLDRRILKDTDIDISTTQSMKMEENFIESIQS